jgi:Response regulator containing a CheY-like receiver domain and an HTH DNA-binding domain
MAIRVLLADDHALVREGIERIFESHAIEVIGHDLESVLTLYKQKKPHVIIMDISIRGSIELKH